ncbi:MAG: hypothetical protein WBB42_01855 [Polyangiales bacterium]
MKEKLEFLGTATRFIQIGAKTLLASGLRAMETKPAEIDTACEPIVLMHGFAGFREIKLGRWTVLEYFEGVPRLLGAMGYRAFAPEVSPFDDPLARAQQWKTEIDGIRARTGAEKVHLVGHSQGGLDARVLVAPAGSPRETPIGLLDGLGYGRHVASVTTLATPHFGSLVADAIEGDIPGHKEAVKTVKRAMEVIASIIKRKPQDIDDAATALTRRFMLEYFNPTIQDAPDVRYYAVAGDPITENVVYPLLRPTYQLLNHESPSAGGGPNDGLVTVRSSLFGHSPPADEGQEQPAVAEHGRPSWTPLGVLQADHIAEVGIPLHLLRPNTYDHLAFFAGLAQFLDDAYTAKMKLRKDGQWERTP